MHKNTPNLNANIYFEPPGLLGGALGGPNLDLAFVWVFFSPNQKIQKTKYVFIGPINTTALESNPNFDIGTLSPPSKGLKCKINTIFFWEYGVPKRGKFPI